MTPTYALLVECPADAVAAMALCNEVEVVPAAVVRDSRGRVKVIVGVHESTVARARARSAAILADVHADAGYVPAPRSAS